MPLACSAPPAKIADELGPARASEDESAPSGDRPDVSEHRPSAPAVAAAQASTRASRDQVLEVPRGGPTVLRILLGAQLRRLR
jgi:hypothetical protein